MSDERPTGVSLEATATEHSANSEIEALERITTSFALGVIRLFESQIVANALESHIFRELVRRAEGGAPGNLPHLVDRLQPTEFDGFQYVLRASAFVYATALFDTFLSDATRFLLLKHPGACGKEQAVPLALLLSSTSRSDALNRFITKKTRELAFGSFPERIKFIRKTFKLNFSLPQNAVEEIAHYSGVRNTIVHDQGVFDLVLSDATNSIEAHRKTCPRHPTPITNDMLYGALRAYSTATRAIAQAICAKLDPNHSIALLAQLRSFEQAMYKEVSDQPATTAAIAQTVSGK